MTDDSVISLRDSLLPCYSVGCLLPRHNVFPLFYSNLTYCYVPLPLDLFPLQCAYCTTLLNHSTEHVTDMHYPTT